MTRSVLCGIIAGAAVGMYVLGVSGCATAPRAPATKTGDPLEVQILSNRGDRDEMTERQYRQRNEVGRWMERDLQNQLRRRGYRTGRIASADEFEPRPGRYFLEVTIDSYGAGMGGVGVALVGVSGAHLENNYLLYETHGQALLEWTDGVGTSKRWTHAARRLNLNAVQKVTDYLRENIP